MIMSITGLGVGGGAVPDSSHIRHIAAVALGLDLIVHTSRRILLVYSLTLWTWCFDSLGPQTIAVVVRSMVVVTTIRNGKFEPPHR